MAGHKRPNGIVVCPISDTVEKENEPRTYHTCVPIVLTPSPAFSPSTSPAPVQRPPPASTSSTTPAALRREQSVLLPKHYVNPNFVESPQRPPVFFPRPIDRTGTPNTWVSTEPADDIPVKREEGLDPFDPITIDPNPIDDGLFPSSLNTPGPSSIDSSVSSTGLRRTFTNLLRNSRPVASLFSTPRDELDDIAHEARRHGLHTGLIHRPRPPPVKEESTVRGPGAVPRGAGLERASSWWLVLGHSGEAVMHLMDLQDRGTRAKYGSSLNVPAEAAAMSPTPARMTDADPAVSMMTGAYPLDRVSVRNSYMDLIIASCIGAFLMFYMLAL